jgi:uncharacterized membrane protein
MNNEELKDRLNKLKIEDFIWIIYLIIIILSFYANEIEREYFINKNEKAKKYYHDLMVFIFFVLLIVYAYFTYDNYTDIKSLNSNESNTKTKFTYISFVASLLIFISGILFLYIAIKDEEIETELAFN